MRGDAFRIQWRKEQAPQYWHLMNRGALFIPISTRKSADDDDELLHGDQIECRCLARRWRTRRYGDAR